MNLMRIAIVLAAMVLMGVMNRRVSTPVLAQAIVTSLPQFDVASIKPADPSDYPGRMGAEITTNPGMLITRSATLKELIAAAYGVERYQVAGGPTWTDSDRFVVQAKTTNSGSRDQLLKMLRPFLADRFKLALHDETRPLDVYALVLSKNAPKLKVGTNTPSLNLLGHNWSSRQLATYLTSFGSDRPVMDNTGLPGTFNLDLHMDKIAEAAVETAGTPPSLASLFQATVNSMEEQLGLKLIPTKAHGGCGCY